MSNSKNHTDAMSSSRSAMYANPLGQAKIELISLTLTSVRTDASEFHRPMTANSNADNMAVLQNFINTKVQAFDANTEYQIEFNSDDLAPFALDAIYIRASNVDLLGSQTQTSTALGQGRKQDICRFKMVVKNTTVIGAVETIIAYGWANNSVPDKNTVFTINSIHHVRDHHYVDENGKRALAKHFGDGVHLLSNPNYSGPDNGLSVQTPHNVAAFANLIYMEHDLVNHRVHDTRSNYSAGITLADMAFENPVNYLGKIIALMFAAAASHHVYAKFGMDHRDRGIMDHMAMVSRQTPLYRHAMLEAIKRGVGIGSPTSQFTLAQLPKIMQLHCESPVQFGPNKDDHPHSLAVWDDGTDSALAFKFGMSFLGVMGRLGIEKLGYHYNNYEGADVTKLKHGFCDEVVDMLGEVPETDKLLALSQELEVLCKAYTFNDSFKLNLTINIEVGNDAGITLAINDLPGKYFALPLFNSALNSAMITTVDGLKDMAELFSSMTTMTVEAFGNKPPVSDTTPPVPY